MCGSADVHFSSPGEAGESSYDFVICNGCGVSACRADCDGDLVDVWNRRARCAGRDEVLTLQGMADCMDMVRQELVGAGLIDERVPPMFVPEALLTKLRQLRAAFHVNMVRAYPERTHADIEAEINRTCWGTAITADEEILALHRRLAAETLRADRAEARATAKSRECIELRERIAARPPIPSTPAQAIGFIGNQFEVREDAGDLERVRFQLTVHDLLSAFRWWFDVSNSPEFDGIKRPDDFARIVRASNGQQVLYFKEVHAEDGNTLHCMASFETYQGTFKMAGIPDSDFADILDRVCEDMADGVVAQLAGFFGEKEPA